MYLERIPKRQMRLWLIGALVAPAAAFSGGCEWLGVILPMVVGVVAYLLVGMLWESEGSMPGWMKGVQLLWLGICAGRIAGYGEPFWPEGTKEGAIPLILLALAWAGSRKETPCAGRVGAVLFWLILPALAAVLLTGVRNVRWEWVTEQKRGWKEELFFLMLMPAMSVSLLESEKRDVKPFAAVLVLAIASMIVINGNLSQSRAAGLDNPLYEYSRSVTLLGTVKGLEAAVACAVTAGVYLLLCLVISASKRICGNCWFCAAAGAVVVLLIPGNGVLDVVGSVINWVALPALEGLRKKLKKRKNNA